MTPWKGTPPSRDRLHVAQLRDQLAAVHDDVLARLVHLVDREWRNCPFCQTDLRSRTRLKDHAEGCLYVEARNWAAGTRRLLRDVGRPR